MLNRLDPMEGTSSFDLKDRIQAVHQRIFKLEKIMSVHSLIRIVPVTYANQMRASVKCNVWTIRHQGSQCLEIKEDYCSREPISRLPRKRVMFFYVIIDLRTVGSTFIYITLIVITLRHRGLVTPCLLLFLWERF